MGIVLALLTLALVFAGAGFVVHVLWIAAVVLFALWLVGIRSELGSRLRS
jgi:hypothetical protein